MRLLNLTAIFAAAATFASTSAAIEASQGATGLGTSWPNTTDVSANPRYHVYRFERQGVRYIQVNDANGAVRGAIGYIANQVIELPVGIDASRWTVISNDSSPPPGDSVYRDDAVSVIVSPRPDGTARLMVMSECKDPIECNRGSP